jgi:uncharacterized SAM-binding protein YcdF (DUF218 family)
MKRAVLVIALLAAVTIVWQFYTRQSPAAWTMSAEQGVLPAAVVFSGGFDRVDMGLALLEQGQVARLLVSGVNPLSGMTPQGFAEQFALSASMRNSLQTGHLALGPDAVSTIGNVKETICWLRWTGQSAPRQVLLITAPQHMPRASVLLEAALPNTLVLRATPPPQPTVLKVWARELAGFAAMWLWSLAPRAWGPWAKAQTCPASG